LRISTKKITLMSMLTAVALIVFTIEAQIPLPLPIPGAKLGLANTITLFALFYKPKSEQDGRELPPITLSSVDAFMILICRIILSAIFSGRFIAFIYSVTGGLLAFVAQVLTKKIVNNKQIWVCGAMGAIFHNIGQIIAAVIITSTPSIAILLPQLIVIGIVSGCMTGLVTQFVLEKI